MNDPIIIADAGPLIRLAAAGLLDAIRVTNRLVVMVDRVEAEVCGDLSKPFAREVRDWICSMGDAIDHIRTVEGFGIEHLEMRASFSESDADRRLLKAKLRNSGERAIREYIEDLPPGDPPYRLVLYEDDAVPQLMQSARAALTLMTTRAFARMLVERGYNADAVQALERVARTYNVKPAIVTIKEAEGLDEPDPDEKPGL